MPTVIYEIPKEKYSSMIDSRVIDIVDPKQENLDSFDGFFTIKEAALWATEYLQRPVSNANISYLINYGKVRKYTRNGAVVIMKDELEQYKSNEKNDLDFIDILERLNIKYRIPIFLYYYEGYKIEEIAELLNMKVSAVKMRLSRAKIILKKEMESI